MKPNLQCYICNKSIYVRPCRQNGHNVCSYSCRNKYFSGEKSFVWKGGKRNSTRIRESDKERRLRYKIRAIEYLGGKCCNCGYSNCAAALDFHHMNPFDKDHNIKDISTGSWEKIKKELDKCSLLCANCHREFHWSLNHIDDPEFILKK